MGDYVDLPGVRTWYETDGSGEPLVLLHGGFCTNATWGAQRADLAAAYQVLLPERRAHGHTPVVALLMAIARPDLVRRVVAIGANFRPSSECFVEPAMLDAMTPGGPDLALFREMYEADSPDGADHWPVVAAKMIEMWRTQPTLTTEDLMRVEAPLLVMVGDDDMMALEHTTALYRAVPGAQLAVVPGASHLVPLEKPALVDRLILEHLSQDEVDTMMPVRRAPAAGVPGGGAS